MKVHVFEVFRPVYKQPELCKETLYCLHTRCIFLSLSAATCNESLLLGVSIENCSSCGNSIDGAQGCVSLTSPYPPAMPGAVATYTCCDGYEALLGVLTPLECMPNGNWNGTPPACVKREASKSNYVSTPTMIIMVQLILN